MASAANLRAHARSGCVATAPLVYSRGPTMSPIMSGDAPLSLGLPPPSATRLADDLEALARLTCPDRPFTRGAFSDEDRAAHAWLAGRMREAGLDVSVDPAGNSSVGARADRPGPDCRAPRS